MKCPICHKCDSLPIYNPFCSKTCKNVDLLRWIDGRYAVPIEENLPEHNLEDED
ncbi:MAG TPA: DNA gyrase inhibitor YacG [Candidatus Nitrosotenuis sp.]|nr:DNA gyrase inhibitor YacG [Candidatus Nitrosotenuis sp.]